MKLLLERSKPNICTIASVCSKRHCLPAEIRLGDEVPDDCKEPCESERSAEKQDQDPQERDARVQERKVGEDVWKKSPNWQVFWLLISLAYYNQVLKSSGKGQYPNQISSLIRFSTLAGSARQSVGIRPSTLRSNLSVICLSTRRWIHFSFDSCLPHKRVLIEQVMKSWLTKYSVDGILVSVDESCDDVHYAQDDQRQQQQRQDRLLGASNQTLKHRTKCYARVGHYLAL